MARQTWLWRYLARPGGTPAARSASRPCPPTLLSRWRECLNSTRPPRMPDGSATLTLTLHARIAEIDPTEWDACAGVGNPFVSHAFLSAMEDSGSANSRTGWLPQHAVLRRDGGEVAGVVPMYVKSHRYGEYV